MLRRALKLAALALICLGGCDDADDDTSPDTGPIDAAGQVDMGQVDAADLDAAVQVDAADPDAADPDAAVQVDAANPDAALVDAAQDDAGAIELDMGAIEADMGGDECEPALSIDSFGAFAGSTVNTGNENLGSCGGIGTDVVYEIQLESGGTICVDTFGSTQDTVLYARSICADNSSELACNDDTLGSDSAIQIELEAGQPAWIFVDGFEGGGLYTLNINEGPCAPTPECVNTGHCPENTTCEAQRCVAPLPECDVDRPCGPGFQCTELHCLPTAGPIDCPTSCEILHTCQEEVNPAECVAECQAQQDEAPAPSTFIRECLRTHLGLGRCDIQGLETCVEAGLCPNGDGCGPAAVCVDGVCTANTD